MSGFKKGDKVIYVRHIGSVGTGSYKDDFLTFNIGEVYTIRYVSEIAPVLFFEGVLDRGAFETQVRLAIPDTKINRVLYPELKPKEGYLV
jgi:hypothetical protein